MTQTAVPTTKSFEGFTGQMAGRVMARINADMEHAAVELLAPRIGQHLLVLGAGPGVGLTALLDAALPTDVLAVDPSHTMVDAAAHRLSRHPFGHIVEVLPLYTHEVPRHAGPFDGAIAVNSHQLWDPHAASVEAVGAVLRLGAPLVSLTHAWAIEKHQPIEAWKTMVSEDLERAGFALPTWSEAKYRSGDAVILTAPKVRAT
ncbi:MAG TPA: class I SAM-dependent methyltransferase [Acidimicrobiales bacterium]|jgi:SAM-dependent methyltransferase